MRIYMFFGMFALLAITTTVMNPDGTINATYIDHYYPQVGNKILDESTLNVDTPNMDEIYGFKFKNHRLVEVQRGGYDNPGYMASSDHLQDRNEIPAVFWLVFGAEKINTIIHMNDGTEEVYGARTSGMIITEVNIGGYDGAEYIIDMDEDTMVRIASQDKPSIALEREYLNGNVRIRSNSVVTSFKIVVADVLFRVFG